MGNIRIIGRVGPLLQETTCELYECPHCHCEYFEKGAIGKEGVN